MSQTVLDAGRNSSAWWVTLNEKEKTSYVGDSRKPINWSRLQSASGNIPRPDLVQDLLGLSYLGSPDTQNALPPRQYMTMSVDDSPGINELILESPDVWALKNSQLTLTRKILVDRRSGDIQGVSLFDPHGIIVVRSVLEDYRSISYTGENNDAKQATPPRFPFQVRIDYPTQHLTVSLKFETVAIPAKIPEAAFETPEFADEGIKVIPMD